MKIRSLLLAAAVTGGIASSQFGAAGSAHAIGGATGGVWKTTNFTTADHGLLLPAVQHDDQESGMWLPAPQKPRDMCGYRC